MKDVDYPALFRSSDEASNTFQRRYLNLIKTEYSLLFLASVLSLNGFSHPYAYGLAALVLGISVVVLLVRAIGKPEQDWYKSRALAESVKTLTWRYAMGAYPFESRESLKARLEFKENLERVFKANDAISGKLSEDWSGDHQITPEMERIRKLPLAERKSFYEKQRIEQQRSWYAREARRNRTMSKRWVTGSVVAYLLAGALSITRIIFPQWTFWPIEPLIVIATSTIGWVQIKKFNELAAAYSLTAHEIGMIKITLDHSDDVKTFSDFVNEAETAFSREHTLWIARQAN